MRNRERLLEAAKAVFSVGGSEASLEAVAKAAGVGIGTLYRHFPTREALFEAVYRREVEQLVALAERLATELEPSQALRQWLHANIELVATKRGMSRVLATALQSDVYADLLGRLEAALAALLRRAIAVGEVRDDVAAQDLMRTVVGICYMHDKGDWTSKARRLIDVFMDGMRVVGETGHR